MSKLTAALLSMMSGMVIAMGPVMNYEKDSLPMAHNPERRARPGMARPHDKTREAERRRTRTARLLADRAKARGKGQHGAGIDHPEGDQ